MHSTVSTFCNLRLILRIKVEHYFFRSCCSFLVALTAMRPTTSFYNLMNNPDEFWLLNSRVLNYRFWTTDSVLTNSVCTVLLMSIFIGLGPKWATDIGTTVHYQGLVQLKVFVITTKSINSQVLDLACPSPDNLVYDLSSWSVTVVSKDGLKVSTVYELCHGFMLRILFTGRR